MLLVAFLWVFIDKYYRKVFLLKRVEKRHKEMEDIFDNVDVVIWSLDLNKDKVIISKGIDRISGCSREQFVEKSCFWRDIVYCEDRGRLEEWEHRLLSGKPVSCTIRINHLDKSARWVQLSGTPAFNSYGKLVRVNGAIVDINDREVSNKKLLEKEEQYHSLFDNNHAVMILVDPIDLSIIDGNPAACSFYGYTRDEIRTKNISDINILSKEEIYAEMQKAKKAKQYFFNFQHKLANGEVRDVENYSGFIKVAGKQVLYSIIHDVTQRKKAEAAFLDAYSQLNQIFNIAADGLCVIDREYEIIKANKAYFELCGLEKQKVLGRKCYDVFRSESCYTEECPLVRVLAGEENLKLEGKRQKQDSQELVCITSVLPFKNSKGEVIGILENIKDITANKKAEAKINHMAYHDALTGLPNRYLFNQYLDQAIERARDAGEEMCVMFIDLDRFKQINDTLGHSFGDLMLQQAGERLKKSVRNNDVVSRYGGDEFIILMEGIKRELMTKVANRIIREFSVPFNLGGSEAFTSPSIGIAIYPSNGISGETLIQQADLAMYEAKEGGRNTFRYYDSCLIG